MNNWNLLSDWGFNGKGKWEHETYVGTFLILENDNWKVEQGGRVIKQVRNPRDPFNWADELIRNNPNFWE